jgi:hypothetical protein
MRQSGLIFALTVVIGLPFWVAHKLKLSKEWATSPEWIEKRGAFERMTNASTIQNPFSSDAELYAAWQQGYDDATLIIAELCPEHDFSERAFLVDGIPSYMSKKIDFYLDGATARLQSEEDNINPHFDGIFRDGWSEGFASVELAIAKCQGEQMQAK